MLLVRASMTTLVRLQETKVYNESKVSKLLEAKASLGTQAMTSCIIRVWRKIWETTGSYW